MYQQSGWMPQFPQIHGDVPPMNGFHSTIMILDAYRKGIKNFDINVAYEAMKKNALDGTMVPWRLGAASPLDKLALKLGYFPALHPGEKESDKLLQLLLPKVMMIGHWLNLLKILVKIKTMSTFQKLQKITRIYIGKKRGFLCQKTQLEIGLI
jgi:hypothetical protein